MIDKLNYCPCNKTWGNCTACYLDLTQTETEHRERIWARYEDRLQCRAIKQEPETVLRSDFDFAMQDKQRCVRLIEKVYALLVDDKTVEVKELLQKSVNNTNVNIPPFIEPVEPTCQIKNLDTGVTETMTREDAKKLQAELGDTVEWHVELQTPRPKTVSWYPVGFDQEGIYTYKLKPNLVKLDGELMTGEDAATTWKSKSDTHVMWFSFLGTGWSNVIGIPSNLQDYFKATAKYSEFELRLKPTVKLTIDDELPKMLTSDQCESERLARVDTHDVECSTSYSKGFEPLPHKPSWFPHADHASRQYRLVKKPAPKLISLDWKAVPVGVAVTVTVENQTWILNSVDGSTAYLRKAQAYAAADISEIELAPASEQPWQAYIHGETDLTNLEGFEIEVRYWDLNQRDYLDVPRTGIFAPDARFISAYRITGLAHGE